MMDGLDSVGVGRAGERWIMMPAHCSLASATERCGLGSDPAVVPPGSATGPPAPAAQRPGRTPDPRSARRPAPGAAARGRRCG